MSKILLVEDDNNLREIYEARLQAEGYDIVTARDGEEALVVAKNERPDLVISDVMMPKISGFEMLDIMRNTDGLQGVKVIMLTALGQAEDQSRAESLGADRYLVKSQVTLEDIVHESQQLLGDLVEPEAAPAAPATPEPVVTPVAPAPVAVAPEPVAIPVSAPPEPVMAAPTPIVEPAIEPTPIAAPVATAPAPTTDMPVIPLASAPPEDPAADAAVSPQMPPTPTSTLPDLTVPEQVAVAPEPVAIPEPVLAPAAPAPVVATPTEPQTAEPTTSAEESAAVEQQIENFVSTQSGIAPPQVAPTPEAAPAPVAPETTTPEQEQALNDALNNLGGGTPAPAAAPSTDAPVAETEATPADDALPVHKKVIEPLTDLSGEPKKSLEQLLAEEAAKEAAPAAPMSVAPAPEASTPVAPTASPAPATPPAPAAPKPPASANDFDPNSISL